MLLMFVSSIVCRQFHMDFTHLHTFPSCFRPRELFPNSAAPLASRRVPLHARAAVALTCFPNAPGPETPKTQGSEWTYFCHNLTVDGFPPRNEFQMATFCMSFNDMWHFGSFSNISLWPVAVHSHPTLAIKIRGAKGLRRRRWCWKPRSSKTSKASCWNNARIC